METVFEIRDSIPGQKNNWKPFILNGKQITDLAIAQREIRKQKGKTIAQKKIENARH